MSRGPATHCNQAASRHPELSAYTEQYTIWVRPCAKRIAQQDGCRQGAATAERRTSLQTDCSKMNVQNKAEGQGTAIDWPTGQGARGPGDC